MGIPMNPKLHRPLPSPSAFALAILLASMPALAANPSRLETKLGLITASTGTWIAYGGQDGFVPEPYTGDLRLYAFNKLLVIGMYGQAAGFPFYLSIPWLWTDRIAASGDRNRIALGDGEFYAGRKTGKVESRIGLIAPLGYDRRDGDPWIGPGNVQVTLGMAFNPNITRYSDRWEAAAEWKWAYALDDAIAKAGSWQFYPGAKVAYRPGPAWKFGLEGQGYWKASYWGRSASFSQAVLGAGGRKAQWGAGLVPDLFAEAYLRPALALGAKAGHSLWGYRDAASLNASLYLLYFP